MPVGVHRPVLECTASSLNLGQHPLVFEYTAVYLEDENISEKSATVVPIILQFLMEPPWSIFDLQPFYFFFFLLVFISTQVLNLVVILSQIGRRR